MMTLSLAMVARKKSPADGMSFWWPTQSQCCEKMRFCSSAKISGEIRYFCARVLAPLGSVRTLAENSSFVDVVTRCSIILTVVEFPAKPQLMFLREKRAILSALMTATTGISMISSAANFGDDVTFLNNHVDVIVLSNKESLARVALVPAWQGRVMTSSAEGESGQSFGWINRELI